MHAERLEILNANYLDDDGARLAAGHQPALDVQLWVAGVETRRDGGGSDSGRGLIQRRKRRLGLVLDGHRAALR